MTEAFRTELRDGTRVLLRPIVPEDRERLREGLKLLSPRSRRMRFHASVNELTEEQLTYLTEIDGVDHVAWVALDLDHPESPGIGVARFVRLEEEPTVAEAAITVIDAYHGKGAGTLLLGLLARLARDSGIEVFRNYVMGDNAQMLGLFDRLGAERAVEAPGVYRVDLPLPAPDEPLPDSPAGRAFREIATRQLELAATHPPLWATWGRADEDEDTDHEDDSAALADWLRSRDDRS
jgi:RimJ/RimL family protein N-acetyltransferase